MKIYKDLTLLVGKTPLLELTKLESVYKLDAKILAKLEYFNPAGSVKDRIALKMIKDAEDKKLFQSEINSGLQSSIDNIDSDISGIRSSISDIQTDVADIQTNITGIQTDVAGISTDVDDIKSDVRDLDEKMTQEINDRLSGDTVL